MEPEAGGSEQNDWWTAVAAGNCEWLVAGVEGGMVQAERGQGSCSGNERKLSLVVGNWQGNGQSGGAISPLNTP